LRISSTQLPATLHNDTLTEFGLIGTFLLLLVTHRSLGLFKDTPKKRQRVTVLAPPLSADDLSRRLAQLELGEKIECHLV